MLKSFSLLLDYHGSSALDILIKLHEIAHHRVVVKSTISSY